MTGDPKTWNARRPCPQCGGVSVQTIHKGRYILPTYHPLDPVVHVVACTGCGFCFNDTPNTREDYDRDYREMSPYADPRLSRGSGAVSEDRERLRDTARDIRDFAGGTDQRILDIGCGAGGLLDSLAEFGFHSLSGMDPAPACAAAVSERGHRGVVGTLDNHPLDLAEFDGVILSHVLEHVRDVPAALSSIGRLLTTQGWLYVEVPDADRYGECLIAPFQDFNLEHINHFSTATLHNALNACGWETVRSGSKTLPLPHGRRYPAIFAFSRPTRSLPGLHDFLTRDALGAYVALSAEFMQRIDQTLQRRVAGQRVAVWGVGQLTMRLLGETSLGDADIAVFVDSNPVHHGRTLAGQSIVAPHGLARYVDADTPIVIGSLVNLESIEASIRDQGLCNPIICLVATESD